MYTQYVCMYVGFQVTDYMYRGSVCTHIDWLYCRDDDECQSATNCFLRLCTNNWHQVLADPLNQSVVMAMSPGCSHYTEPPPFNNGTYIHSCRTSLAWLYTWSNHESVTLQDFEGVRGAKKVIYVLDTLTLAEDHKVLMLRQLSALSISLMVQESTQTQFLVPLLMKIADNCWNVLSLWFWLLSTDPRHGPLPR